MLREFLTYWTTPVAHPAARKLGYVYESVALAARWRRCQPQWRPHYDACRDAIVRACEGAPRGRVLVLGGGLLRDVPLAWLSGHFETVTLVDLVWLRSARRLARRHANVRCVERDVTEQLIGLMAGRRDVPVPEWGLDQGFDVVVSLNLVTQLPLLPARWLMKQEIPAAEIDRYGRELMSAHLAYLRRFAGARVCLIADRRIVEQDRAGRFVDGIDPWWGLAPPAADETWWWEAVPRGEGGGFVRRHQVGVSYWRNR